MAAVQGLVAPRVQNEQKVLEDLLVLCDSQLTNTGKLIDRLNASWVWTPDWVDSSSENTVGRIVHWVRSFSIATPPATPTLLHCSADTRYKLLINGKQIAVGPSRGCSNIWYFDTIDIAPYLLLGDNIIRFIVLRYFASNRAAMPFERTAFPGLTVVAPIRQEDGDVDIGTGEAGWKAFIDTSTHFPQGTIDDGFLHIYERVSLSSERQLEIVQPRPYGFKTLNGDLLPWRLRPRQIPMPEVSPISFRAIHICQSAIPNATWLSMLQTAAPITLAANSVHKVDLQADVHSTAFLTWSFTSRRPATIKLKIMYSEGYELEPRSYPYFRSKKDRLDAKGGHIVGPFDEVTLTLPGNPAPITYEPFWFRTFRVIRLEMEVGSEPAELTAFGASQVNYPLEVQGSWNDASDPESSHVWDVSVRTLRNCMFDGYSDCPFYEQLQYSGDSRAVGLFHYLISGDDRLMRQGLDLFASSVTPEGLTQSRFPSHVNQLIAAFPLYWILSVCDHYMYFGDTKYSRSFVPLIDGVLEFFDRHIDERGLVNNLPPDVWQFVDWVTTWHATDEHPDKGVPTSGRKSNLHTYFSLLLIHVLDRAQWLLTSVGRPGNASEYSSRALSLRRAVRRHCYDGHYITDSTADIAGPDAYSQHCQVFAILADVLDSPFAVARLLDCFNANAITKFSKCSYMMQFYAFRALAKVGDDVYERAWPRMLVPWKNMLANNLTTWEEDDVRQRSDCHAWGSVPLYEYCTELAGIQPLEAGFHTVLFKPRLRMSEGLKAKVAVGKHNVATVEWTTETQEGGKLKRVRLEFIRAVRLLTQLPSEAPQERGLVEHWDSVWREPEGGS